MEMSDRDGYSTAQADTEAVAEIQITIPNALPHHSYFYTINQKYFIVVT